MYKVGENPSSGVEDALTRRWTYVHTDGQTDGEDDDNIRSPLVAFKKGFQYIIYDAHAKILFTARG